jgi:hypothetical protein
MTKRRWTYDEVRYLKDHVKLYGTKHVAEKIGRTNIAVRGKTTELGIKLTKKRPTHKKCKQCGEWFSLSKRANLRQKFCSYSCAAKHRCADPRWRRQHSQRMKDTTDPEVMRERSRALWRDPKMRAHLIEQNRIRANSKEDRARFVEHNKKLWANADFRKRHAELTSKRAVKQWRDPAFRDKIISASIEASKQRWADPEYKRRVSKSIRIAKRKPEARARQSKVSREAAQRPERRARSSELMRARWQDEGQRARMVRENAKRRVPSWRDPVFREKKLAVLRAWAQSPEHRAAMSERNKGPEAAARRKAWWTLERRIELAETNKKRWSDPKFKARISRKISKARRRRHAERNAATP